MITRTSELARNIFIASRYVKSRSDTQLADEEHVDLQTCDPLEVQEAVQNLKHD